MSILHGIFECDYYEDDQETIILLDKCRILKDFGELKKDEQYDRIEIDYRSEEIKTYHPYDNKWDRVDNPNTIIKRFKFTIIPE
jgi:hypothetical protein